MLTFVLAMIAIVYAFRRGGQAERVAAAILVGMLVVTYGGHAIVPRAFHTVDVVALTVDLIGFVGFSWLALGSRRLWPLWAASLQLLSSGAHFVRALAIPVKPWVYFWMKSAPTWLVMILLIVGTWNYQRRRLRRKQNSSQT